MTADDYLSLIDDWRDPFPTPHIEQHDDIYVVRDDLLNAGSKVRFLDYLIGRDPSTSAIREWVFGSCPATGYAQISLPVLCARYDKTAVLFMAQRDPSKLHEYQKRGASLGAVYQWVPNGMLSVTQKRARDYANADPTTRQVLPLGLEHPTVIASIIRVARSLPLVPDVVWTVGSSGTLSRGLQLAWPDAEVHVVSVGHQMSERERGRAHVHLTPYKFDRPVRAEDAPPFPSAPTYDAKAWRPLLTWRDSRTTNLAMPSAGRSAAINMLTRQKILLWNVGA